jgi:hypothetical protein
MSTHQFTSRSTMDRIVRLLATIWCFCAAATVLMITYCVFDFHARFAKVSSYLIATGTVTASPVILAIVVGLAHWVAYGFEDDKNS